MSDLFNQNGNISHTTGDDDLDRLKIGKNQFLGGMDTYMDNDIEKCDYLYAKNIGVKLRGFCGVDNGVSGSIGIIYEDGTYEFVKTPVKKAQDYTKAKKMVSRVQPLELTEILSKLGEGSMVLIERPMINSTRFNASMSAIRAFEATITILETLGLPYAIEDSKSWQKALLPSGLSGDDLKTASLDIGNRLFPKTKLVKHADCDGMLIAQYCKQQYR